MTKEETTPVVRHEDDITPYAPPAVPRSHIDLDKEVRSTTSEFGLQGEVNIT
jgi:hypothetical protein